MTTNAVRYLKWFTWGAIFLIPFLPFLVSNDSFFPFISGKNFAFRILVEAAFAGWVVLALADARYRPRFSWTFALFALLVVWMVVADAFAVNPSKAFWSNFERMEGWITLFHAFLLFVVAGSVLSADKLWRKWWFTFVAVAAYVSVYGLLQALCTGHGCAAAFPINQSGVRVDGRLGNSAYLASYLLFSIAASLWLAFEEKKRWLRYGLFAFGALATVVLFYTETRGAILAFVGALFIGALFWMLEAGKKGRRNAGILLVALLVIVGAFFGLRHTSFVQHIPGVDRLASISLNDGETTTRFVIWNIAFKGFLQRPITGWGQEGFNYVFNTYYSPKLYKQEPWFDRAHDVFLDWLVAGGLPAFLLFIALLVSSVLAVYKSTEMSRIERTVLIGAIAAYCFQGLFVFDNLFTYLSLAVILAMAHATNMRAIPQLDVSKWRVLSENAILTRAVPVAVVVLALTVWFVNVPSIRASHDIITAITPGQTPQHVLDAFKQAYADHSFADQEITEQLVTYSTGIISDQSISTPDKQVVLTYTFQQLQMLLVKIPNDARLQLEFALALRSAGDYKDALPQVAIAERLSPQKQGILIEKGIEQMQSGDGAGARVTLNKAYQLDPEFHDLATYAAAGDIVGGDVPAGKALLVQTFGTTSVTQTILLAAYYNIKDYTDLIALLRQQVVDTQNSANAEFQLAAALSNAGRYQEARAQVKAAMVEHPEAAAAGAQFLTQIPNK